jgi:hypothetical protein
MSIEHHLLEIIFVLSQQPLQGSIPVFRFEYNIRKPETGIYLRGSRIGCIHEGEDNWVEVFNQVDPLVFSPRSALKICK